MGNYWIVSHPAAFWTVLIIAVLGIAAGLAALYHYRQH